MPVPQESCWTSYRPLVPCFCFILLKPVPMNTTSNITVSRLLFPNHACYVTQWMELATHRISRISSCVLCPCSLSHQMTPWDLRLFKIDCYVCVQFDTYSNTFPCVLLLSFDQTESPTSAQLISTPSPTGPPSHSPSSAGKLVSPVSAAPIMWCTVVVSHVLH